MALLVNYALTIDLLSVFEILYSKMRVQNPRQDPWTPPPPPLIVAEAHQYFSSRQPAVFNRFLYRPVLHCLHFISIKL